MPGSRRISFQPASTEGSRPGRELRLQWLPLEENRSILPTGGRSLSRGTLSPAPPGEIAALRPGAHPTSPRGRACSSSISEGPHLQSSQERSPQLPTQDKLGPWRGPGVPEAASCLSPGRVIRLRAAGASSPLAG